MDWSDVAAIGSMAVSAALAWYVIKGHRTGFRTKKEEAADKLAIRAYDWYDGSLDSAIQMVDWLRHQIQIEQAECQRVAKEVIRERDARLRSEVECETRIQAVQDAANRRIAALDDEVARLKAGLR